MPPRRSRRSKSGRNKRLPERSSRNDGTRSQPHLGITRCDDRIAVRTVEPWSTRQSPPDRCTRDDLRARAAVSDHLRYGRSASHRRCSRRCELGTPRGDHSGRARYGAGQRHLWRPADWRVALVRSRTAVDHRHSCRRSTPASSRTFSCRSGRASAARSARLAISHIAFADMRRVARGWRSPSGVMTPCYRF